MRGISSHGQFRRGLNRDQIDDDEVRADCVERVVDAIMPYHRPEWGLWQKFEVQNTFSMGDAGEELEFIVQ